VFFQWCNQIASIIDSCILTIMPAKEAATETREPCSKLCLKSLFCSKEFHMNFRWFHSLGFVPIEIVWFVENHGNFPMFFVYNFKENFHLVQPYENFPLFLWQLYHATKCYGKVIAFFLGCNQTVSVADSCVLNSYSIQHGMQSKSLGCVW
jgi:hypothetical protein